MPAYKDKLINAKTLNKSMQKINKLLRAVFGVEPDPDYTVQLIRSLFVSIVALAVDFSLLVFLKQVAGVNYLVAAVLGFMGGVTVNYFLSITWVFTERQFSDKRKEYVVFVVITSFGLLFNLLIIAGMVELIHTDYRVGKAVSTVVVFFWNFLARKKILY